MKNEVFAFGVVLAVVLLFLLLHRGNVDSPAPAPAPAKVLTTAPTPPLTLIPAPPQEFVVATHVVRRLRHIEKIEQTNVVTFPVKFKSSSATPNVPHRARSHHHRKSSNDSSTPLVRNGTTIQMRSGNSAFSFGVDGWQLPSLDGLRHLLAWRRSPDDLKKHPVEDFAGNPVSYATFPPLRLNPIGPRQYLVYIYVNRVAIEAALNLIVSIRRYDIQHVLLLCEDPQTAEVLDRVGLYHYYPEDLVQKMNLTIRGAYWGPSMWVRCNFNHHMIQHGVSVAFFDADIVLVDDPRPVLFAPVADMSTSFRMASFSPWVWSFPFYNRDTWHREPTLAAALNRHFLELNNGLSRYDSNPHMVLFFEVMRQRMVYEIQRPAAFPGWDQTAQARALNSVGVTFPTALIREAGNEKILVSAPNPFNLTVALFQTLSYGNVKERLVLGIKSKPVPHFAYHAYGHVRHGSESAWYVKLAYIHAVCWLLSDQALANFRAWSQAKGETEFWRQADSRRRCCVPRCNESGVRLERSGWVDSLLPDFVPLASLPPQFRDPNARVTRVQRRQGAASM
eukprot:EG_transcript_5558